MNRRSVLALLSLLMVFMFVGCGDSPAEPIDNEVEDEEPPASISWIIEPTDEYDDFDELAIDFGIYCGEENEDYYYEFGSCIQENKGYPQQWHSGLIIEQPAGIITESFSYDPGAISVRVDNSEGSLWGVIDYEGNIRHIINIDSPITGERLVTLQGIGYRDTTLDPEMIESRYHILAGDYSEILYSGYLPTGVGGPYTIFYYYENEFYRYHCDMNGVKNTSIANIPNELCGTLVRIISDNSVDSYMTKINGYMFIKEDKTPLQQNGYYFKNYVNGYYVAFETYEDRWNIQRTEEYGEIFLSPKCIVKASTGERITDYIYEDALYFEEGYCPVKKDGKWGLINENGEEVTDFVFDKISSVYDGKVAVMIDGKFGIISFKDAELSKETMSDFLSGDNN